MAETKKEETWQERMDRENKIFKDESIPEFHKFMKEYNVKYFTLEFSGGGDSGDFESVYFVDRDEIPKCDDIRKEAGLDKYDQNNKPVNWDDPKYQMARNKFEALHEYYMDPLRKGHKYLHYKPTGHDDYKSTTLSEYIKDFIGEYMSYKCIDWYNNEGGYGEVIYKDGKLEIEVETYYRESDTHNFSEVDNG